jgi:hypothetical protein
MVLIICIGWGLAANVVTAVEAFYSPVIVEKQNVVFSSDKGLLGINSIGNGKYIACFRSESSSRALSNLEFVIYDSRADVVVESLVLEGTCNYSIEPSLSGDLIAIYYGCEGYTSTCVVNGSGEIQYNIAGVELVVSSEELIAIGNYSPQKRGQDIGISGTVYRPLLFPGQFAGCDWDAANSCSRMCVLRPQLAVVLRGDDSGENRGWNPALAAYDISCNLLWSINRTALDFRGHGMLGGRLYGTIMSYSGTEVVDLESGKTQLVSTKATGGAVVFGEPGLFFCGIIDGATEGTLNLVDAPEGPAVAIAPYLSRRQPDYLFYEDDVLYTEYGPRLSKKTAVVSQDLQSAIVLDGVWRVTGTDGTSSSIVGGVVGDNSLYRENLTLPFTD